ncbi:MAG: helix-turn-helix transcriptional regulator, partial [Spirochaetia bacterium]|nr:helix-turn-helix transcriptional regulator [Spirochaetia bacterium]
DHTRRRMLARLRGRPMTISELAEPFSMSFAGAAKHIEVLTQAGLVRKVRAPEDGRSFRLELQNQSLSEASAWLAYHQEFWTNKLDRLENFIEEEHNADKSSHADSKNRKKN